MATCTQKERVIGFTLELSKLEAAALKTALNFVCGDSDMTRILHRIRDTFPEDLPVLKDGEGNGNKQEIYVKDCKTNFITLIFERQLAFPTGGEQLSKLSVKLDASEKYGKLY